MGSNKSIRLQTQRVLSNTVLENILVSFKFKIFNIFGHVRNILSDLLNLSDLEKCFVKLE